MAAMVVLCFVRTQIVDAFCEAGEWKWNLGAAACLQSFCNSRREHWLLFPFQVGIVLMSILCHIWKIVPDLYEAITRITNSENEAANFTQQHLQNCSVRDPVSDVSILIYWINVPVWLPNFEKKPWSMFCDYFWPMKIISIDWLDSWFYFVQSARNQGNQLK